MASSLMSTPCFLKHRNEITAIVTSVKALNIQLIYSSPLDLVSLDILAVQVRRAYPAMRRQC